MFVYRNPVSNQTCCAASPEYIPDNAVDIFEVDLPILPEILVADFENKTAYWQPPEIVLPEKTPEERIEELELVILAQLGEIEADDIVEALILKQRGNLVAIPLSGEVWHPDKNYITGDTAQDSGELYTALKYSKNKQPSLYPQHWQIESPVVSYPIWEEQEELFQFDKDAIYQSLDGLVLQVKKQHLKSALTPFEVGSNWKEVT